MDRYKARLVAKGFSQHVGSDFCDSFSPVVCATTVQVVLAVVVMSGWKLRQVDVNNAFLNGTLLEESYMDQPPSFEAQSSNGKKLVCKLNKALYGLRQEPKAWFHTLRKHLVDQLGFCASKADFSLFIRTSEGSSVFLMAYVDDIIITGNSDIKVENVV